MYQYRLSKDGHCIAVKTKMGWGRIASVHHDGVVLAQCKASMLGGDLLSVREFAFGRPASPPDLADIVGDARLSTGPVYEDGTVPVLPYDGKFLPLIQIEDTDRLLQCPLFKAKSGWNTLSDEAGKTAFG